MKMVPVFLFVLAGVAAGAPLQADERDVIINEIMYHPPNDRDDLQFVEVFNRGASTMDLTGWSFSKGIQFAFPAKTQIAAGDYLVVCRDISQFQSVYGREVAALGNFTGKLKHRSDHLELSDPQKRVVDSVKYSDRGDWPAGPDGNSSSLERISPSASSQRPENWAGSRLPPFKAPGGTPGRKNDNFSAQLPPAISGVEFAPKHPEPGQAVAVRATVTNPNGVKSVTLQFSIATTGRETTEQPIPMSRRSGDDKNGVYEAVLTGPAPGNLVRFRIAAVGTDGVERTQPSENEPRRTYSFFVTSASNTSRVPLGFIVNVSRPERGGPSFGSYRSSRTASEPTRGNSAFIYIPAGGGEIQTFDHVRVTPRKGGYKVHFNKDQTLRGMTGINLISEGPPRWILSEPLAYELYRMAGVPAPLTEHVRVSVDGRARGCLLLIEQPNKAFLARNKRDDAGNLYKLLWYGNGVVGQHEKKTNPATGHADLVQLIDGLNRTRGVEQWNFIQKNFNVDEVINYFAVNMCIQNWDGFFNNYFTYHIPGPNGKWEIYPWDEDKTWGDYDGASPRYDWYEMPLTFGMNGDQAGAGGLRSFFNRGPFGGGPFGGGASWWRPPGYFSGPLLANPEFRKRFLARLREICQTVFTEEKFFPVIAEMERRVGPEMGFRGDRDVGRPPREFPGYLESFRAQVQNRRKFILNELGATP